MDALALAYLRLRSSGLVVAQLFWGLWLFPFGMLVIKSRLFPRILGVLLIVACVGYVSASSTFFVLPAYSHPVTHLAQLLGGLGECAMILWLLIKGVKVEATA